MVTYKLFRLKGGKLYPLFVDTKQEMPLGKCLEAKVGELADASHVKSRLGPLSLRPGFHSTEVPFTDWIGMREGDRLVQRPDTVWCECEVTGEEEQVCRNGKRTLPADWYYFRTKARQPFPWIISNRILIKRILSHAEVSAICRDHGIEAQPQWAEGGTNGE